jgi:(p)ppGpp synthase/HD superfamily hydrolase
MYLERDGISHRDFQKNVGIVFILAEMHLDYEILAASLLYVSNSICPLTVSSIRIRYGANIANIVSECQESKYITEAYEDVTASINMLTFLLQDRRVILIFLAKCLHILRFPEGREDLANLSLTALHFYSHLAYKLGLNLIKEELEDRAFKILYPVRYRIVTEELAKKLAGNQLTPDCIILVFQKYLRSAVNCVSHQITGRIKKPYSIYRKMYRGQLPFEAMKDIYAYRMILDTADECYVILGKLHSLFTPIMGYFKDYIGNPKPNGYQALHTTLLGPYGLILEVQITTKQMYMDAAQGRASHHLYKHREQHTVGSSMLRNLQILRDDLESSNTHFKPNSIYVITPKNRIIILPKDSTILDLAYKIHTSLGRRAHYGIVNNRRNRIDHKLHSGAVVEVVTFNNECVDPSWLSFVVLPKAIRDIKRYIQTGGSNKFEHQIDKNTNITTNNYVLCKQCAPVYNEKGCYLDIENRVHLRKCPLLLMPSSNEFSWSCLRNCHSYITCLYLYYTKKCNSQAIITTLVKSEIHLINFIIYNDHIKISIDINSIDQLHTLIDRLAYLEQIDTITRLPAKNVS